MYCILRESVGLLNFLGKERVRFPITIFNQKKRSVNMILNGLKQKDVKALLNEHTPSFATDLYPCLTVQVENSFRSWARRELNRQEKELMIEWATINEKAARQRSVRQETTMFKAGTLPLNMYRAPDNPKDKVSFSLHTFEEETFTSAAPLQLLRLLHRSKPLKMINL